MSSQHLSGPALELYTRVQAAAANGHYTATPTADGFEVSIDLRVPQWSSLLLQRRVKRVLTHRVSLDPPNRRLTITDVLREVQWTSVGGVVLGRSIKVDRGRVWHKSKTVTIGKRDDGRLGVVDQDTFSSEEGRRLITDAARALGWTQRAGWQAKAGLIAGLVGGVGALVAVLLALIIPALTD